MATTTNYGWTTPDDTALVKDGAAAIRTLGTSADTTVKNLNPETTLGDIAYRSSTANVKTRLGIGSTGNVLTVSGGVPAWAAPAAGATNWTLLNSGGTALTGATSITVSFTAPKQIMVVMVGASSVNSRSFITLRPNNISTSDYTVGGIFIQPDNASSSAGIGSYSGYSDITFGTMANAADSQVNGSCFINLTDQTGWKNYIVTSGGNSNGSSQGHQLFATQGILEAAATITSITVISSTGNFDNGTIYILGAN